MKRGNKSLNFGFSTYDTSFPKATRPPQERRVDLVKKFDDANNDTCIFELLATVAGQLLQDQKDEASSRRNQDPPGDCKKLPSNAVKRPESYVAPSGFTERESEKATTCEMDSSDLLTHKYSQPRVNSNHQSLNQKYSRANAKVLHDYSVISCLDHPCLSMAYELKSKKRKNSGPSLSQKDIPLQVFVKPQPDSLERNITKTADRQSLPTAKINSVVVQKDVTDHCEEINLMIQNSFHVVDAESPPLVSSGSSDETAFLMEPTSDSTTVVESKQRDVTNQGITKSSNKFVKAKRIVNEQAKNLQSKTATKRKYLMIKEKENVEKDETIRGSKVRTNQKTSRIRDNCAEKATFPPINIVRYTKNVNTGAAPEKKQEDSELAVGFPTVSNPVKSIAKKSGDHVKFSINSFLVPELQVDLPASATIANLKKAVMDATVNLISGGLCVRVLLQGKKVVDESESLLQAGISNGGMLGFMLEPESMYSSTSFENGVLIHPPGNNRASVRYPVQSKDKEAIAGTSHISASERLNDVDTPNSGKQMQSTSIMPSKPDIQIYDGTVIPDSSALILHASEVNNGPNGLAVVPFEQNAVVKRRMRRPFTVAEVEMLVQAVEKLGTGRWRDVKLHAFPHSKHRTYVDLKDKWKTLVHTASIAPHQRRGEPVPQGLLDRVIQAHSYWTAQQAKQQPLDSKMI